MSNGLNTAQKVEIFKNECEKSKSEKWQIIELITYLTAKNELTLREYELFLKTLDGIK